MLCCVQGMNDGLLHMKVLIRALLLGVFLLGTALAFAPAQAVVDSADEASRQSSAFDGLSTLDGAGPHNETVVWLPFSSVLYGLLVPLIDQRDLARLEIAALSGDTEALFTLGLARLRGEVGDGDFEKGMAELARAAEQGHPDALAFHSFYSLVVMAEPRERNSEAWQTLTQAIDDGSDIALVLRGLAHQQGMGTAEDPEAAVSDYRRAHRLGVIAGTTLLGISHIGGIGTTLDRHAGRALIEEAAAAKEPLAHYTLAALDFDAAMAGFADAPPPEDILRRLGESVDYGVPTAIPLYAWCLYWGFGTAPDREAALALLDQAMADGEPTAAYFRAMIATTEAQRQGQAIPQDAIDTFLTLADAGHPFAQTHAAFFAANGIGMKADKTRATAYARRGSELGDGRAALYYAAILLGGLGDEPDVEAARAQFEHAAALGFVEGNYRLADLYWLGHFVPKDPERALAYLEPLVAAGVPRALYRAAEIMTTDAEQGTPRHSEGHRLMLEAAERGYIEAQSTLGFRYYNGLFLEMNRWEAYRWFVAAVNNPAIESHSDIKRRVYNTLAVLYAFSESDMTGPWGPTWALSPNWPRARALWRVAVDLDHPKAMANLAVSYFMPEDGGNDFATAKQLLIRASELTPNDEEGPTIARNWYEYYWDENNPEADPERALEFYFKAGELGMDLDYSYLTGQFFNSSRGIPQNHEMAYRFAALGAEEDCRYCRYVLGNLMVTQEAYRDLPQGRAHLESVIGPGYEHAWKLLADSYMPSTAGPEGDWEQYYYWLEQYAAATGHGHSNEIMGDRYRFGTCFTIQPGVDNCQAARDIPKAVTYYVKCQDDARLNCGFKLAVLREGREPGAQVDPVEALSLYRYAAERGHYKAATNLALMYANGRGTARDLSTAMYWCLVALRTATEASDKNYIAPTCNQIAAYFDALTLQGIRSEAAAFQPLPHE